MIFLTEHDSSIIETKKCSERISSEPRKRSGTSPNSEPGCKPWYPKSAIAGLDDDESLGGRRLPRALETIPLPKMDQLKGDRTTARTPSESKKTIGLNSLLRRREEEGREWRDGRNRSGHQLSHISLLGSPLHGPKSCVQIHVLEARRRSEHSPPPLSPLWSKVPAEWTNTEPAARALVVVCTQRFGLGGARVFG
jgi:hypothetical protein